MQFFSALHSHSVASWFSCSASSGPVSTWFLAPRSRTPPQLLLDESTEPRPLPPTFHQLVEWEIGTAVTSPVSLTQWSATVRLVHPLRLMLHLSVKSAAAVSAQNETLFTQISLWHILGPESAIQHAAAAGLRRTLPMLNTPPSPSLL